MGVLRSRLPIRPTAQRNAPLKSCCGGKSPSRLLPKDLTVVLDRRLSDSHKGFGIVTWHTKGLNQRDELAIDFKRTNLVRLRNP